MYQIKKEVYLKAKKFGYAGVSIEDGKTKWIMLPNKDVAPDYKGGTCLIFEHKLFEIIDDKGEETK